MSGHGGTAGDAENHTHGLFGGGRGTVDGGAFTTIDYNSGGWGSTYGINESHWHAFDVTVTGNVAGTHTIDVNTYDDPGPLKGTVGWVGINWIIGSGKLP